MNSHIKAILKKLEGHRDEVLADLDVYLMHPVGVGDMQTSVKKSKVNLQK